MLITLKDKELAPKVAIREPPFHRSPNILRYPYLLGGDTVLTHAVQFGWPERHQAPATTP